MFLNNVKNLNNIIFTIQHGEFTDKSGVVLILDENNNKIIESGFSSIKNSITGDLIVTLTSTEKIPTGNYKIDFNKIFTTKGKTKTGYLDFNFINPNDIRNVKSNQDTNNDINISETITTKTKIVEPASQQPAETEEVVYSAMRSMAINQYEPVLVNNNVNTDVSLGNGTTTNTGVSMGGNGSANTDTTECYPIHKVYTSFTNEVVIEFISRVKEYDTTKFIISDRDGIIKDYEVLFHSENELKLIIDTDRVDNFITILFGNNAINENNNIYKFSVQLNARMDYFTSYIVSVLEYHSLTISPQIELVMWYILNRINSETKFEELELTSIDKAINCVITSYNTPFILGLDKMNNKKSSGSSILTDAYLSSATIGPLSASWDRKVLTSNLSTGGTKKDFGEENFNECFVFLKMDDLAKGLVANDVATVNPGLVNEIHVQQKNVQHSKNIEHIRESNNRVYGRRSRLF